MFPEPCLSKDLGHFLSSLKITGLNPSGQHATATPGSSYHSGNQGLPPNLSVIIIANCLPSPCAKLVWPTTVFINLEYLSFFEDGTRTTILYLDWKILEYLFSVKTLEHCNL
jgi:hypothetical protein